MPMPERGDGYPRWLAMGVSIAALGAALMALPVVAPPHTESTATEVRGPTPHPRVPSPGRCADGSGRSFVGVIMPNRAVDVTAQADGRIVTLRHATGQHVKLDDELAVTDSAVLRRTDRSIALAALRGAEADEAQQRIALAQAADRVQRLTSLDARQLVSAEHVADAQYSVQLTTTRLAAAEHAVAERRMILDRVSQLAQVEEIRAPFDGIIAATYLELGAAVRAGTAVFRLVQAPPYRLRFAVPAAADTRALTRGGAVVAQLHALGLTLSGAIDSRTPEVDSATQMFMVDAILSVPRSAASPPPLLGRTASVTLGDDEPCAIR